jgi:hypothetical protein
MRTAKATIGPITGPLPQEYLVLAHEKVKQLENVHSLFA